MGWILSGAGGSIAEIPVPLGNGVAVAIHIGGVKLHAQRSCSAGGTGGKGRQGEERLHRAEINQAVLRSWITALVGGEGVGGHAARANGGRAGQGRHRLRWPAIIAERGEGGSVGEGSGTGNRAAGVVNRLDEVRAAIG